MIAMSVLLSKNASENAVQLKKALAKEVGATKRRVLQDQTPVNGRVARSSKLARAKPSATTKAKNRHPSPLSKDISAYIAPPSTPPRKVGGFGFNEHVAAKATRVRAINRVNVPDIETWEPLEGDIEMPKRDYVDEEAVEGRVLPSPGYLAPPATNKEGRVLKDDEYRTFPAVSFYAPLPWDKFDSVDTPETVHSYMLAVPALDNWSRLTYEDEVFYFPSARQEPEYAPAPVIKVRYAVIKGLNVRKKPMPKSGVRRMLQKFTNRKSVWR
ncbi:hypothetical protein EWM64_g4660 [Hericium alpestre]|uniref:Uncharacterized protein n=1 Tax=Hericium alpestre TaxID=135208 RepID=A0A4Y9ZZF4_9AGAM|nr:hypothetical protein EWM64_g4660 [Hericium alpestre]